MKPRQPGQPYPPEGADELRSPTEAVPIVAALFRSHAKRLRGYLAYRLRNEEDGKDASQEVFLKLWRQEKEGNLRDQAVGYMHAAANTVAIDAERWRGVRGPESETGNDADDVPEGSSSLEDQLHWRNAMALFVSSVKRLPTARRQVFVLHYLKGLPYREISAQLGLSERSIERYMAEALADLHERLRDYL